MHYQNLLSSVNCLSLLRFGMSWLDDALGLDMLKAIGVDFGGGGGWGAALPRV